MVEVADRRLAGSDRDTPAALGRGTLNCCRLRAELAESLDDEALAAEARRAPCAWVQRLGYLLALVDASGPAAMLEPVLAARSAYPVALAPSAPTAGSPSDPRWRVAVNVRVEPDR